MALYQLDEPGPLAAPALIAAFDGWIDAGGASTTAAEQLAEGGEVIATFDGNVLFDYRARRPTLDIVDGRLAELTWPELSMRRAQVTGRDLLVLSGAEPDFRWHELADSVVELARRLGVVEWISIGAIPAAVPHTRPVPIIGSESRPGLLKGDVKAGPQGTLRVPAAAISVLEMAMASTDIPALGYYAQIPHYISGPYPTAAVELLRTLGRHLDMEVPLGGLAGEADDLRARLDTATSTDETTRTYVERLEAMHDEARLPSGDDLIADIERFLRDRGGQERRLN